MTRTIHLCCTLLCFVLALAPFSLSHAQETTSVPPISLNMNEPVIGQLRDIDARVTYTVEVPADQDVVIAYFGDRVIVNEYCTTVLTVSDDASVEVSECFSYPGGGGDDLPVSRTVLLPSTGDPETQQTVLFTLFRPIEGTVHYEIVAHPVTPQTLIEDQTLDMTPDEENLYQVYTLEIDPSQPFTIAAEAASDEGSFLWVAHNPYDFISTNLIAETDEHLLLPHNIDGASLDEDEVDEIAQMTLYYLGEQTFRLVVEALGAYSLHTTALNVPTIAENQSLAATISYTAPIQIVRLEASPNTEVIVNVRITDGIGAVMVVNSEGVLDYDNGIALGATATGSSSDLAGTLDYTAGADGVVYILVRIPNTFTRDSVTIEVSWQQG